MVRFLLILLLLSGGSILVDAQDQIAKGRIIDAETKQVIPYVNIGVFQKNTESNPFKLNFPIKG